MFYHYKVLLEKVMQNIGIAKGDIEYVKVQEQAKNQKQQLYG